LLAGDTTAEGEGKGSTSTYPLGETLATLIGFREGAGLEYSLDSFLAPKGNSSGSDFYLTIDLDLQRAVFADLEQAMQQSRAARGAALALNSQTGEILALADAPGYDPNHPRLFPTEVWSSLAAASEFEPGPAFKLFPALALAVSGDTAQFPISNFQFPISNSAASLAGRVDPAGLMKLLTALGFGQPTGIELPSEVAGDLPEVSRLKLDTTLLDSLLQGKGIGMSLLQLAQAASVVVDGGNLAAPHLVARLAPSGKSAIEVQGSPKSVLKASVVTALRRSLPAGGPFATSASTSSADTAWCLSGISVQSGTSSQTLGDTVLLAFGWFPVDAPQVVIAVLFDRPFGGSTLVSTPGDLLQAIARQIRESLPASSSSTSLHR
jgi:cell division protein FtsI (penicillin-binding protein 3)